MTRVKPVLSGDAVSGTRESTELAIVSLAERAQARSLLRGALGKAGVFLVALVVLFSFVVGVTVVRGDGMKPAASDGDVALFSRLNQAYQPGDVVVYEHDGARYLGRVVAGVGTSVEVTDEGNLKLNGNVQDRIYGQPTMPATDGPSYPLVLSARQLFVVGDNREGARDSREFGPIDIDDVQGKVISLLRSRGL